MQNQANLGPAFQAFQKELTRSTEELQAKDQAFKAKETETKELKEEIDQMQREIEIKRRKWSDDERMLPRLRSDAERAREEHVRIMKQVETAQKTSEGALKGHKNGSSGFF
jgi:chromosome segregation ATPase